MSTQRPKVEYGDFQTPSALAEQVCKLLHRQGVRPRTVVEPTCGEGSFLEAAARAFGKQARYFGFDVNPDYVATARQRLSLRHPDVTAYLQTQDFFTLDWKTFLENKPEPILFLGNPPWVTSSVLGALGSDNMPAKSNLKALNGLDARTGKANFDISEWMLLHLMEAAAGRNYALALLCKTGVARKALEQCWRTAAVPDSALYRINAASWFDASVDACLLLMRSRPPCLAEPAASVFDSLDAAAPTARFGLVDGRLVSDVNAYRQLSHLSGVNYYRWRSGVKHDLAKVMELRVVDGQLLNGFGGEVSIEEGCLYPLLKASDLAKGDEAPERYVIITQTTAGENTDRLRQSAPRAWRYLEQNDALFAQRKSSIYRAQPKYALFGLGPYSFAPFKIAVSGLHKTCRFALLTPRRDKPVFVDDTCYFIGCFNRREAALLYELLNSEIVLQFLQANVFNDSKRPVTADVLNRLDVKKIAEHLGRADDLVAFLRKGTTESNGQGLLVFEAMNKDYDPAH